MVTVPVWFNKWVHLMWISSLFIGSLFFEWESLSFSEAFVAFLFPCNNSIQHSPTFTIGSKRVLFYHLRRLWKSIRHTSGKLRDNTRNLRHSLEYLREFRKYLPRLWARLPSHLQNLSFYLVRQLRPSLSSSMNHFVLSLSNSPLSFLFFLSPSRARTAISHFLLSQPSQNSLQFAYI